MLLPRPILTYLSGKSSAERECFSCASHIIMAAYVACIFFLSRLLSKVCFLTGILRRIPPLGLAALLSLAHCVVALHCPFGGPRRPATLYSHPKEWLSFHASRGRGQIRMASKTPWGHHYTFYMRAASKQWACWCFCSSTNNVCFLKVEEDVSGRFFKLNV